ncbi:hypothetical protein DSO57_1029482 [Entomophthora muscae]|uniref:Uncharacterized protein n=1 Tax=Entomophthora muscae TaxID=34485 RepID=A0ACC2TCE8_9FUNG|nr:hypothetical protein DSO57_1029482 [Entomophthora muscae]
MSFTSCWTGALVPSPSSPWGENRLSHACLLRQPQSPPLSPLSFRPSLLPSRTPLTLPFPVPFFHALGTI